MSEPSSTAPGEADTEPTDTEPTDTEPTDTEPVTLDVDEEKLQAWDDVKADYQVDPGDGAADDT